MIAVVRKFISNGVNQMLKRIAKNYLLPAMVVVLTLSSPAFGQEASGEGGATPQRPAPYKELQGTEILDWVAKCTKNEAALTACGSSEYELKQNPTLLVVRDTLTGEDGVAFLKQIASQIAYVRTPVGNPASREPRPRR